MHPDTLAAAAAAVVVARLARRFAPRDLLPWLAILTAIATIAGIRVARGEPLAASDLESGLAAGSLAIAARDAGKPLVRSALAPVIGRALAERLAELLWGATREELPPNDEEKKP